MTIVISSLVAFPTGFPNFSRLRRSAGVTVTRRGSLARRILLSSFRYWTWRANAFSVQPAGMTSSGWKMRAIGDMSEDAVFSGMTRFFYPAQTPAETEPRGDFGDGWKNDSRPPKSQRSLPSAGVDFGVSGALALSLAANRSGLFRNISAVLFGWKTALSVDKENSPIAVSANHVILTEESLWTLSALSLERL